MKKTQINLRKWFPLFITIVICFYANPKTVNAQELRCEISTPAFYTNVNDSITRFNDVPYSHRYAEAIYEANNLRWVNGTGNNNFAPEKESSMKEFIMVLSRAMYGTGIHLENALSFGTNDGWLDAFSVSTPEKLNKKIRREQMYQSIFNATDTLCYGAANSYLHSAATDTAISTGLCPINSKSTGYVTRGEMANAIFRVVTNSGFELNYPEHYRLMNLYVANNQYIDEASKTIYTGYQIPIMLWREFFKNGGRVVIGDSVLSEYEQTHNTLITDLYTSGDRTIHLYSYFSLCHEMGHFVYYNWNLSHKMQTIYQKEKDAAKSLLGNYSSKNPSEMFAESFETYIRDPKSRTKMQKQLPLTYALLDNIAKTNWTK